MLIFSCRATSEEEGQSFATSNGMLYFETSAKTNTNVTELFYALAQGLPKTNTNRNNNNTNNGGISLRGATNNNNGQAQKNKSACC